MRTMSRFILTHPEQLEETKTWSVQKGVQHKDTLAVDAHGMPAKVADCTQGCTLIDGILAERLMGDKGYDSNAMIAKARE